MKQLHYVWGYIVGVLLLGAALPASELIFDSLILKTSLAILFIISGIAVLWRKALGWYLYFVWIVYNILVFADVPLWLRHVLLGDDITFFPWFMPGVFSFSSGESIAHLSLLVLTSLFLYLQIRYWRRRAPLYKRNKIAV